VTLQNKRNKMNNEIRKHVFYYGKDINCQPYFAQLKNLASDQKVLPISDLDNQKGIVLIFIDPTIKNIDTYLKEVFIEEGSNIIAPVITVSIKALEDYETKDSSKTLLDSGIWFRYYQLKEDNWAKILLLIGEIEHYYANIDLYKETKKQRKHYISLLKLSFDGDYGFKNLINLPSETEVTALAQKKYKALSKLFSANKNPLANCLLLSQRAYSKVENRLKCIMSDLLKDLESAYSPPTDENSTLDTVEINIVENTQEALELMENGYFDIIMFDYKNGDPSAIESINYLKQLQNDKEKKYKRGPGDLFWVLPISLNPPALFSHMQKEKLSLVDKSWYISRGVDPFSHPHFFFYKLVNMLSVMAKEAGFIEKHTDTEGGTEWEYDVIQSLKRLIIEHPKKDKKNEIQSDDKLKEGCLEFVQFKLIYSKLIEMHTRFKQIKFEKQYGYKVVREEGQPEKRPLFAAAAYEIMRKNFDEVAWARLISMFYLLAYGSQPDWMTIWDDALYLEEKYKNENNEDLFKALLFHINKNHN
jgi:hypothetical protein